VTRVRCGMIHARVIAIIKIFNKSCLTGSRLGYESPSCNYLYIARTGSSNSNAITAASFQQLEKVKENARSMEPEKVRSELGCASSGVYDATIRMLDDQQRQPTIGNFDSLFISRLCLIPPYKSIFRQTSSLD